MSFCVVKTTEHMEDSKPGMLKVSRSSTSVNSSFEDSEESGPEVDGSQSNLSAVDDLSDILGTSRLSINSSMNSGQFLSLLEECPPTPDPPHKVTFKAVAPPSPMSSKGDPDKTQPELLDKIERLMEKLKQAEIDISAEKAVRKKKEKSLMKLAKELKKRNQQRDKDAELVEKLADKSKQLEHLHVLAQKELSQQAVFHQRSLEDNKRSYERALEDAKTKYESSCKEHDSRIKDINKAHAQQCEQLCQEVIKANLDADRLQSKLCEQEDKSIQLAAAQSPPPPAEAKSGIRLFPVLFLFLTAVAIAGNKRNIFTRDGLCAPVMPGSVLKNDVVTSSIATFQAPWWAPSSLKGPAYEKVCGEIGEHPTQFQWIHQRGNSESHVKITHRGKTVLNKRAATVEINADHVVTTNRKGHLDNHYFLW